nr:ABC transporter ATP-binding protein [Cohnella lubricantis]
MLSIRIEEAGYEPGRPYLRDISFEVRAGERLGLLGPNGAGKSTVMKGLLGQLPHWKGQLQWRGEEAASDPGSMPVRRVAYIPEQPILYDRFTLWEHLQLAAAAAELPEDIFEARAEELLHRFRLTKKKDEYPVLFSKGMQQKVMLITAFLLEPELFLVDEPFIGLDPGAIVELLAALDEERARGASVILTTHVLDSAERLCDRFVLVHDGGVAASGTIGDIRLAADCPADTPLFDCFRVLTAEQEEEEARRT